MTLTAIIVAVAVTFALFAYASVGLALGMVILLGVVITASLLRG